MFRTAVQSVKTLYIFENGVWGVAPSGVRAAAPHSAPSHGEGVWGSGLRTSTFLEKQTFSTVWNRRVSHGGFILMYRIHKIPPIISAII